MSCQFIEPNYEPFKCSDLPDLSYIMAEHLRLVNEKYEELLKGILKQIIGREVVNEDAKDLAIIRYPGDIMDHDVAYKGVRIGRVMFTFDGPKTTIIFTPDNKYNRDYKPN